MGLLDRLERGIERVVRGAFSGRGGSLGPVEIATAVRRHIDREAYGLSEGRSLAPNLFKIRLSEQDFAEAKKYGVTLAEELCDEIIRHADSQGYTLVGPVKATFVKNTELKQGQLSIESQTDRHVDTKAPAPAQPASGPAAGPSASAAIPQTVAQPAVPAPSAPQAAARIVHDGVDHPLYGESLVIGRSSSADVTVADTGISRRHLEVLREGPHYYARDLDSTNGSYVDGEKLSGSSTRKELYDGALISLGNARLRFRRDR